MVAWKAKHNERRERAFGVHSLTTREELRSRLQPLLAENAMVHEELGPDNDYRFNPEAAEAAAWKHRVKATIIPNSLAMLAWMDSNGPLLTADERKILEKFRFHVQGLMMKHLEGENLPNSRFPQD